MTKEQEQFKNVLDAAAKSAIRDTTPDSIAAYIHCYVSASQMGII